MTDFERLANEIYTIEDVKRSFNKETRNSLMEFARWGTRGVNAIDWIIDCDIIIEKANLTEKQKTVLHMTWHESKTYREVAEMNGVSINAIHLSVRRSIEKIQSVLELQREVTR